jgi:hypothetical protein|nr:MAG TPA: AAA domain protein [Caudoviricetes sp.]
MAIKRNKVKVDLASYPHYILMGEPKVGKTYTMYELAKLEYSLDEMLLISCGSEQGYKSLADIQYEEVLKFSKKEDSNGDRGFVQVVDDLVKNHKELGIKMVVIDTLDTLFDIATEHVMEESRRQTGKPSKSLNDCFGGYMRGRDRLLELVMNEIHKLDRLPIALFILGHTKYKGKKDTLTNDEYEQLTTNLRFDFYSPVSNSAQMIVNLATERVIEDGIQVDAKRYMYFTSNGLVDCGSRFEDLPEKLELSAENFMKAFRTGVENSLKKSDIKHDVEELRKEEKKEQELEAKQVQQEVEQQEKEEQQKSVDELKSQLKEKLKTSENKTIVKDYMKEVGSKSVATLNVEQLQEVLSKLQ